MFVARKHTRSDFSPGGATCSKAAVIVRSWQTWRPSGTQEIGALLCYKYLAPLELTTG